MHADHRHLLRRTVGAALAALLLSAGAVLPVEPTAANAAGSSLALSPAATSWAKIGGARKSVTATVTIAVPAALPVRYGLQLRSGSHDSGYRASVEIAADGHVTGSIGRVRSGVETALLPATPLGLQVAPGDDLRLDASVVAAKRVWVYLKAGARSVPSSWQLAVSDASRSRLTKAGRTYLWAEGSAEGRLGYRAASAKATTASRATAAGVVPPEPGADTFSFAVIPDTQAETNVVRNTPFLTRVNWMVANTGRFDLRYVLHTGDMTNWGWLDPGQFDRARAAIKVLADGGLPYALAIGNHDTAAVGWNGRKGSTGYGGSAYQYNPLCRVRLGAAACSSRLLIRHTEEFNQAFPVSGMGGVGEVYAYGRSDNYWTSFTANGTSWLVLTLELWPRRSVVAWAASVVAAHPDHNVIIQTHHYLDPSGKISSSDGGYGATSPRYLYEQVVAKYPNVKLVFSGHNGGFRSRSDSPDGHTVVSYLGNELAGSGHDPVRVVSINTRTGSVFTIVHDPLTQKVVSATSHVIGVIG